MALRVCFTIASALLGLASMVGGTTCDCKKPTPEPSCNCTKAELDPVDLTRTCRWRVKEGQIFEAVFPSIFQTNIESCSWRKFPGDFGYLCEQCAAGSQPCNNSHAACGGCSCTDPQYKKVHGDQFQDFFKKLGEEKMMTHLTCDHIKTAFKNPNYNTVDCDDEKSAPQGNISAIRVDVPDAWNKSVIESGVIKGGCKVHPTKIHCTRVPFLLKFECDDCTNKGSVFHLEQCCKKCKEFVDNLESQAGIPGDVLPIGFCSGCNSTHISHEEGPMPNWAPTPWDGHKDYAEYTEEKAIEKYDDHIDKNVCQHLTPHCKSSGAHEVDETGAKVECHEGTCEFDPDYDRRLAEKNDSELLEDPQHHPVLLNHNSVSTFFPQHFSESCPNLGGQWRPYCSESELPDRRLEAMEPTSDEMNDTELVEDPLFCPNLGWRRPRSKRTSVSTSMPKPEDGDDEGAEGSIKAVIKTIMGLPGTVEMYKTDEAKTALRHGFANTLDGVLESWITVSVKAADGGRRLSDVSAEFTMNVPSTSTVEATAIAQSVESVDNAALATNLQESFAEHAPAVDVATVDFKEVTVELVGSTADVSGPDDSVPVDEEESKTTGAPSTGDAPVPVALFAIVGGGVVLSVFIATALRQWTKKKHNREEANKQESQPKIVADSEVAQESQPKNEADSEVARKLEECQAEI